MASFVYYKTDNGYTIFNAYIERAYDTQSNCVTFDKRLNENFGDYTECTISVPTDLQPEVCENAYNEKMLYLGALGRNTFLTSQFSRFPLIRLPIKDGYAYFDIERHNDDDAKVGKTIRVKCRIKEG